MGTHAMKDRVLGCYIDYNTLDIFNPNSVTVSDTFFYNGHAVLHGHPGAGVAPHYQKGFTGLRFEGNTYALQKYGGKQSIVLAEIPDALEKGSCQGVVIKDEINGDSDWRVKQTTFRLSKTVVG